MKKVLLSLLVLAFMASGVFAADGMKFGIAANNVMANIINAEFTGIIQFPTSSVFVVINDMVSIDLGAGMSTITDDTDTVAITTPYLKVLYNITTGKNRLHAGAYYAPAYIYNTDSSTARGVYSDIGLIIGGESMLTDALAISLDIAVLQSVSSGPEDEPSLSSGTVFMMLPQIGLRWYI